MPTHAIQEKNPVSDVVWAGETGFLLMPTHALQEKNPVSDVIGCQPPEFPKRHFSRASAREK